MKLVFMRIWTFILIFSVVFLIFSFTSYATKYQTCEIKQPIKFGGMNWESNLIIVDIERFIIEKGYGCQTEIIPTEPLLALTALIRGDLDVNSEIWLNSMKDVWEHAEKTGKVKRIGDVYIGGESWFIPSYTSKLLPELKSASDLSKFKEKFEDSEEPGKGRFYGCPAGWGCEIVCKNLFHALGLNDTFLLYPPGAGVAQKAAITSSYKRKKNIAFVYWFPTSLVSTLNLVKLDLPEYDAEKYQCLLSQHCVNPQASGYPENPVFTAVNTGFSDRAPQLTYFLSKVAIPLKTIEEILIHMEKTHNDINSVTKWFLRENFQIWSQWVPSEIAIQVQYAL